MKKKRRSGGREEGERGIYTGCGWSVHECEFYSWPVHQASVGLPHQGTGMRLVREQDGSDSNRVCLVNLQCWYLYRVNPHLQNPPPPQTQPTLDTANPIPHAHPPPWSQHHPIPIADRVKPRLFSLCDATIYVIIPHCAGACRDDGEAHQTRAL